MGPLRPALLHLIAGCFCTEGEGFPVRRGFADDVPLSELDPFVHFDHFGEVDLGPGEPQGDHQDANGGSGRIADGDTQ